MLTTLLACHVVTLRPGFLARVRETGRDDQDQPVVRFRAAGGEPLRDLLRRARPGEEIILASYCPFERPGPFREYGPVYVSAAGGAPEADLLFIRREESALDYFGERLTLRAYGESGAILDAALVDFAAAPEQLDRFLAQPTTAWVDARFPVYGCFAVRFSTMTKGA